MPCHAASHMRSGLLLAGLLMTSAFVLAPTASAGTCTFAEPELEPSVCGAVLTAICVVEANTPKPDARATATCA